MRKNVTLFGVTVIISVKDPSVQDFSFFSKTVSDLNLLSEKESSLKVTFKMF